MQANRLMESNGNQIGGLREGNVTARYLAMGEPNSPNNYAAFFTDTEEHTTPRHKHNFDQIRYVIQGEGQYGDYMTTPGGTVLYVPEGVAYGPQSRSRGMRQFTVQFGGSCGAGYVSNKQRRAAMEALSKKGTFEKGIYSYVDDKVKRHNQDAFEACWAHVTGKSVVYPEPRYSEMILMDPRNYGWVKQDTGVAYKQMGVFTERNTCVGFIKLDSGATLIAGTSNAPEILFLAKGAVTFQGATYDQFSALAFKAGEGPVEVKANEASEFLSLKMPRFDGVDA